MENSEDFVSKIKFDAEDRLPPAYWDRLRSSSVTEDFHDLISRRPLDPAEWVQAPEFIPKHRRSLADSFGYFNPLSNLPEDSGNNDLIYESSNINNVNVYPFADPNSIQSISTAPYELQASFPQGFPVNHVPLSSPNVRCVPFPSASPYDLVPKGYSANFTAINPGVGPPIAAIVLKKKRKRRPRKPISKLDKNANEGPTSSREDQNSESRERDFQTYPKRFSSEQNLMNSTSLDSLSQTGRKICRGFSCPHFSDEQLTMWDDILYDAICSQNKQQFSLRALEEKTRKKKTENQKLTNVFQKEVKNFETFESEKEVEIRPYLYGSSNSNQNTNWDTTAQPVKTNQNSSWNSTFDSRIDQNNSWNNHRVDPRTSTWTTWNPKMDSTFHQICNPDYDMMGKVEEDYYEGMRVQVNAFNNLEVL
ncbi:hypothetical protein FO519_000215 [Halicephalobus sp. NKZ332]|nr:hypothetical protein FO519_000215 [Halicephalobus sp. NKZ332]